MFLLIPGLPLLLVLASVVLLRYPLFRSPRLFSPLTPAFSVMRASNIPLPRPMLGLPTGIFFAPLVCLWIILLVLLSWRWTIRPLSTMALMIIAVGANLVSLGYLQKSGASYTSVGTSQLRVSDIDGAALDVDTMKDSRWTPVSMALVQASAFTPRPSSAALALDLSVVPQVHVAPFADSLPPCAHPDLASFPNFLALRPGLGLCELYGVFAGACCTLYLTL